VLDRLNVLLEPNGCLSLSERGVIGGAVPTVTPHPEFRYDSTVVNCSCIIAIFVLQQKDMSMKFF